MLNGVFKLYGNSMGRLGRRPLKSREVKLLRDVKTEREEAVESYLVRRCRAQGWLCLKFVSPGHRAVPDRLILVGGGWLMFVELKRPGGKPRPDQLAMFRRFARLGHPVYVVDSKQAVDELMKGAGRLW